ncbi:MAG TPA: HEAT repeat domain-containing protein [Anaerolineales bacterium]|nr:HEAT repeat domain-containing protein [Anaerolineales bacterium]
MRVPLARRTFPLFAAALVSTSLACALGRPTPTPVPEIDAVLSAMGAAEADPEAAFLELSEAIGANPAGVEATALSRLEDPNADVRLFAVYSLAETASSAAGMRTLVGLLEVSDVTERMLAAEGLLRRGEPEGIPALIAALAVDEPMRGAEPPIQVWDFARDLLLTNTDQDFGLSSAVDAESADAARPSWEAWWAASGRNLTWDETELYFRSSP